MKIVIKIKESVGKGKRKTLEDMLQQNEGVNLKRGNMQKTRVPVQERAKCSLAINPARLEQEGKGCGTPWNG